MCGRSLPPVASVLWRSFALWRPVLQWPESQAQPGPSIRKETPIEVFPLLLVTAERHLPHLSQSLGPANSRAEGRRKAIDWRLGAAWRDGERKRHLAVSAYYGVEKVQRYKGTEYSVLRTCDVIT